MLVREALKTDADAIADIYNESIDARDSTMELTHQAGESIVLVMESMGSAERLVVLEDGGSIQGWGILKRYSEREGYQRACETSVFLRRGLVGLRTGSGSAIQSRLLQLAREAGYHHVVVKIWATNQISIRMHERFGFEIVGTQREIGYVDGQWRDVTIMQCILDERNS
jgi:phosphinothricin acetyltransferase